MCSSSRVALLTFENKMSSTCFTLNATEKDLEMYYNMLDRGH